MIKIFEKIKNLLDLIIIGKFSFRRYYTKARKILRRRFIDMEPFAIFDKYRRFLRRKDSYLKEYLSSSNEEDLKKLWATVGKRKYSRILIYPSAVRWNPLQRPQQFLKALGEMGFLCFFGANDGKANFNIKEVSENVFIVNKEEVLIQAFRNSYVIFYITWIAQKYILKYFPYRFVWYDIVDTLKTFSFSDSRYFKKDAKKLLTRADFVTYSAQSLKPESKESVYIPNGVDMSVFGRKKETKKNMKTFVYSGALDPKWFDWNLLKFAAKKMPDWNFNIIGKNKYKIVGLTKNIHFCGEVPYKKLPTYFNNANVGIIPFKANEITDHVLPCKMFDYLAAGLPVVSAGLKEVAKFQVPFVISTSNREEFIDQLTSIANQAFIQEDLRNFALEFDWSALTEKLYKAMCCNKKLLKCTANFEQYSVINVCTPTFFDFNGNNFYGGGAERYLIDLCQIVKKHKGRMRVYQKGNYNWVRYYKDVEVVGIPDDKLSLPSDEIFSQKFVEISTGSASLTIFSPFSLVDTYPVHPSIGISHGIYWDNPQDNGRLDDYLVETTKILDTMVSVDTNTANWFQTRDYQLGKKIKYIPNYVDVNEFHPTTKKKKNIVITYPRRLYEPRGYYLVLGLLNSLLEKYKNVEFHFVGRGFDEDTKKLKPYIKKWGNRVKWYCKEPDEMHTVYEKSDICLIPTLYSEGTSLSCLEALASGNIVVATRIGGLTDLILNNFNGFLVEPTKESLEKKLIQVVENITNLDSLKKNARESAMAFNKKYWEDSWSEYIPPCTIGQSKDAGKVNLEYGTENEMRKDYKKIITLLEKGNYVFIKIKKSKLKNSESFGRLQFV